MTHAISWFLCKRCGALWVVVLHQDALRSLDAPMNSACVNTCVWGEDIVDFNTIREAQERGGGDLDTAM